MGLLKTPIAWAPFSRDSVLLVLQRFFLRSLMILMHSQAENHFAAAVPSVWKTVSSSMAGFFSSCRSCANFLALPSPMITNLAA